MVRYRIECGGCLQVLTGMPDGSVQCCVTSPPYFGLRDYGHPDQIGLEKTPAEFIENLVQVFREVRRVLADDGTLWLNIGDSYANDTKWGGQTSGKHAQPLHGNSGIGRRRTSSGCKSKELMGIPWQLAFALSADGWYLRQDIIWHKSNPMPESVRDRCTKAHEYMFLFAKSEKYFFDSEAMKEPAFGGAPGNKKPVKGAGNGDPMFRTREGSHNYAERARAALAAGEEMTRNRRSVWTIATKPYREAHFATFPPALVEPCVLAGSRPGDCVLDPFAGSGTTGDVCVQHGREFIGIELNPEYVALAHTRIANSRASTLHTAIQDARQQIERL